MELSEYRPRPRLVTKITEVRMPRFPVIDAHNHTGDFAGGYDKRPPQALFDALDAAGVSAYVDLDGGWGEDILRHRLDTFKAHAPERYTVFAGVNWARWPEFGDGFGAWAAGRLREQARWGAQGLKIWKPFGLHVRDQHGALVAVDDARLDPLWATAGELKLPTLVHIADPVAFFDPLDARNERWEELQAHMDWHFPAPPFPPFLTILEQFANLVTRHHATTFIGAHVACYGEDLGWVSAFLDRCPNLFIDFSARISELGRQPYAARRLFLRHSTRILFGTDSGPDLETYRTYFRFLETDDEYFNYSARSEIPQQGRWMIYGLHLPDDVLRAVYAENARRILRF